MATISNVSQFSPTQISGCVGWFDGKDPSGTGVIPAANASVSTWVDKSGQANNAISVGSNPTYNSNGYVFFNGANTLKFTSPDSLVANNTFSIFLVEQRDNVPTTNVRYWLGGTATTANTNLQFGYRTSNQVTLGFFANDYNLAVASPITNEPFRVWGGIWDGTSKNISLNGTVYSSAATGNLTSWSNGSIGYYAPTANFYTGNIAEIIFFKPAINNTQRQQVEGYLAWKWNLQASLPSTHPFYTNPFLRNVPITPIVLPFAEKTNYSLVPTQISGCALWLDAADANSVVLSGSNVTQWNDKSGNVRHMSNATLASTPTYNPIGFNNLPTISFSPTIFNFLQNTSFSFNSVPSVTLFIIVQRVSNTITYQRFFSAATTIGGADQSSTTAFNLNTSSANDGVLYERNNVYTTKATLNTLNPSMIELIINGSSTNIDLFLANNNYIYTNGSLGTSSTGSGNGNNFNLVHVRLGNAAGNIALTAFEQLQGNISEVVMFNRTLNLNEFRQVEGYLAWKWNLQASLPSTHPFFRNPFIANLSIPTPIANVYRITNTSFRPPTFSALALWLDAADRNSVVLTGGSNVTQWSDKSGNGRNATTVNNLYPTYNSSSSIVKLPTIRFTATNWSNNTITGLTPMALPNFQTTFDVSLFYISIPYTNIAMRPIFIIKQSGTQTFIESQTNMVGINLTSPSFNSNISTPLVLNTPCINTAIYSSSLSNFNGGQNGSNTSISVGASVFSTATPRSISLGAYYDTVATNFQNLAFNGELLEVICYNAALTTTQRQQVEGYLAWKWNLQKSLPTNHPFYLYPPG